MALLKYLPLPSLNPATQSPSYLVIIIVSKTGVTKVQIKVTLVITTMLCVGDQVYGTPLISLISDPPARFPNPFLGNLTSSAAPHLSPFCHFITP